MSAELFSNVGLEIGNALVQSLKHLSNSISLKMVHSNDLKHIYLYVVSDNWIVSQTLNLYQSTESVLNKSCIEFTRNEVKYLKQILKAVPGLSKYTLTAYHLQNNITTKYKLMYVSHFVEKDYYRKFADRDIELCSVELAKAGIKDKNKDEIHMFPVAATKLLLGNHTFLVNTRENMPYNASPTHVFSTKTKKFYDTSTKEFKEVSAKLNLLNNN